MTANNVTALLVATSFAAGLNVYATVGTLGLLGRLGVIALPSQLQMVEHTGVIAVCLVLFVVEFFADKIPLFDLIWNALHTFVRVPIAACLAYAATADLPASAHLAVTTACGAIALLAHGAKTGLRAIVTPSPEPLSNIALSLGEDAVAISLTWLATHHPWIAAAIAIGFVVLIVLFLRLIVRAILRYIRWLTAGTHASRSAEGR